MACGSAALSKRPGPDEQNRVPDGTYGVCCMSGISLLLKGLFGTAPGRLLGQLGEIIRLRIWLWYCHRVTANVKIETVEQAAAIMKAAADGFRSTEPPRPMPDADLPERSPTQRVRGAE